MSTPVQTAVSASSPDAAAPLSRGVGEWAFGPLLRRLHFYIGVLVGPFLVVAALTGLAYTITPQLDQLAYGDQLRVAEVGAGVAVQTLPLAD